jgi:GH35 family endo-1,4-beta-xylanase
MVGAKAFRIGAIDDAALLRGYYERFAALLNTATLPFYWGQFEPVQGQPRTQRLKKTAEWLLARGCTLKGHPLCWHTVTAPWLLAMHNRDILQTQINRIRREVSAFTGLIDIWDVVNEAVIMPVFDKYDNGITRICSELGRIRIIREMFAAAKKTNPQAMLLINDFDTSQAYDILIEGCLEAGIPIDAIGIQSHMHQGYWGVEKTCEILERFSRFNLPLHFTENTLVSGRLMPPEIEDLNDYQVATWPSTPEGEERQAQELALHYRTLFAHPRIASITWWGLSDGGWLNAPSGLLYADNTVKPAYREMSKLIRHEWWTGPWRTVTDDTGSVLVSGFLGTYEVCCKGKTGSFLLDKGANPVTITIEA